MAVAFSMDLRNRVAADLRKSRDEISINEIAEKYSLSASVVYAWGSKLKKTGSIAPRERRNGVRPIFSDDIPLLECLKQYPNYRLQELAAHFNTSKSTIHFYLKKFKISLKKRLFSIKKLAMKSEQLIQSS